MTVPPKESRPKENEEALRDGTEMLPERFDQSIAGENPDVAVTDADIDEALEESFPASDPPASYHIA